MGRSHVPTGSLEDWCSLGSTKASVAMRGPAEGPSGSARPCLALAGSPPENREPTHAGTRRGTCAVPMADAAVVGEAWPARTCTFTAGKGWNDPRVH